jgi:phosphate transport system substrate-binding protein
MKLTRNFGLATCNVQLGLSLVLVALVLAGCAARATTPTPAPTSVVIAGATAVEPLLAALVEAFQHRYPTITVILRQGNAYQGLQQVLDREAALGAVSVASPDDMWTAPIALEGIALVVHPGNPLGNLTLAQVHDVFGGQTWRWSDLGFDVAEDEITVVSREWGSGTRMSFEALAMAHGYATGRDCQPKLDVDRGREGEPTVRVVPCDGNPVTPTAVVAPSSMGVIKYVKDHPGAIGYVSQGYVGPEVKMVRVEELAPVPEDITGGGYHLTQPFFLVALEEPTGAARLFVDFCLSPEGQEIVGARYVPVRAAGQ